MTSKPTARERFDEIKKDIEFVGPMSENRISFLLSLVEAAVEEFEINSNDRVSVRDIWERINQRMAVRKERP